MAAAKVEIIYEAEATSLKAVVNEINKSNDQVVDSAKKTASKIVEEFKGAAVGAGKAFANQQFVGALKNLNNGVAGLTNTLKLNTEAFKKFDTEAQKTNKILVQSAQDVAKYEDRLRELSVAGQRNTDEFKDIAKAVGEYKSAIIAADRAVDLYAKSTDAATGRIGELEDKLYDLALAGQSNTQEFRDLVKEVATVRRAVIETDAQVDALAQRGAKLKGFVQSVELVGVAFQAVEGAAALVGEENEELQKTLVRLQAIMAITSALEQGRVIIMEQLAAKTGIAALAQKAYTLAVAASTGAISAFRVALAATGILAFVGGVVLLIDRLKDAADNQAAFNRVLELSKQAAEGTRKAINDLSNSTLDTATKIRIANGDLTQSEADRRAAVAETQKSVESLLKTETGIREKAVEQVKRLSADLAKSEESDRRASARTGQELVTQGTKNLAAQLLIQENVIKDSEKRVQTLRESGQVQIAATNKLFAAEENAVRRDEAKKRAEDAKKAAEDAAKAELEARNAAREKLRQLELDALATQLDEREKVLSDSNAKITELEATFAEGKFAKGSVEEKKLQDSITLIKEQATKDIAEIDQKALDEAAAKKKEAEENLAKETTDIRIAGLDAQINAIKTLEITEGTSLDRRIQLIELDSKKRIELAKGNASEIELINAQTEEAIRAERKKSSDEAIDQAFQIAQAVADTLGSIIELQGIQAQKRIEEITATSEAEKLAIEQSTLSEANKQRKLEALRIRTEQKVAAEKTRQAKAEKAAALFEAIIGTAAAIAKAGNPFLAIIAGAAGAAQIAIISATPIPKFKKGGPVGGRSHEAGGTLIEAERGEYVVNKSSVSQHRKALDAMNTSSAAFKKFIDEKYVRPAIAGYAMNNKRDGITVNASLNSKSMERELKGLRKDMRNKNTVVNINGFDSRYSWHQN
jgi:hypothetical protein